MGAFNTVNHIVDCPSCDQPVPASVQFKYGLRFQFKYNVGDLIEFHSTRNTAPEAAVVADGITDGACPNCGTEPELDMFVFFAHGVITSVEVADGRYSFLNSVEPFIILVQ
jgi:hypothetical protein